MPNNTYSPYVERGFETREEYLESLADEYGVPVGTVFAVADLLGESEDFDGLVNELQDIS